MVITKVGRSREPLRSIINQYNVAFNNKIRLFPTSDISWLSKNRFIKAFVWSVILYGRETCTAWPEEKKRLLSF